MKNPLHIFDSRFANPLSDDDVAKSLGQFLHVANNEEMFDGFANRDKELSEFSRVVRRWFVRLQRYDGVTKSLVGELNSYMDTVPSRAVLVFDKKNKVLRLTLGPLDDSDATVSLGETAYVFCELLQRGCLDKLKKCEASDCDNFHVRRGKWCDDGCGSRERQRDKRKRDKERQML